MLFNYRLYHADHICSTFVSGVFMYYFIIFLYDSTLRLFIFRLLTSCVTLVSTYLSKNSTLACALYTHAVEHGQPNNWAICKSSIHDVHMVLHGKVIYRDVCSIIQEFGEISIIYRLGLQHSAIEDTCQRESSKRCSYISR